MKIDKYYEMWEILKDSLFVTKNQGLTHKSMYALFLMKELEKKYIGSSDISDKIHRK